MSNLAVINFSTGDTLTVSGRTTFGSPLLSNSTASFQGLTSTNMIITGTSTFNNALPTSTQTPTSNSQLTTKVYVDIADGVLNSRITDTDAAQRIYIDASYTTLYNRITDTTTSTISAVELYTDNSVYPINTLLFGNLQAITTGKFYLSIGSDNTTILSVGSGNICIGRSILSSCIQGSNNVCYGAFILQNFNPASNTGNNVAFGSTLMQALTTGISNVAICQSVLGSITTSQMNTSIGNLSGTRILGSFNTCIGSQTGQAPLDTNIYSQSTALGYNAQISASNQIVLGTINETTTIPGILRSNQSYVRNPAITITVQTTLSETPLGSSQYVVISPNSTAAYTVFIPQSNLCNGQEVRFFNKSAYSITLQTPSSVFSGKGNETNKYIIATNTSVVIHSDGTEWGAF